MHGFNAPTERLEQAKAMRSGGAGWRRIVATTGISMYLLRCDLEPGFREREQQKIRDLRSGMRHGARPRRMVLASQIGAVGHKLHECQIIPSSVLIERDNAITAPLTLGQIMFGDPLPGRSALDKKRKAEAQVFA